MAMALFSMLPFLTYSFAFDQIRHSWWGGPHWVPEENWSSAQMPFIPDQVLFNVFTQEADNFLKEIMHIPS